jgi:hypothetical protein
MRCNNINTELVFGKNAHMLISLPIVRGQGSHLVEYLPQVMLHLFSQADSLFEQVQIANSCVYRPILYALSSRVSLLEIGYDSLMNL